MTKKSATDIEIVPLGTAVKTLKELGQERQFIASWLANSVNFGSNEQKVPIEVSRPSVRWQTIQSEPTLTLSVTNKSSQSLTPSRYWYIHVYTLKCTSQ